MGRREEDGTYGKHREETFYRIAGGGNRHNDYHSRKYFEIRICLFVTRLERKKDLFLMKKLKPQLVYGIETTTYRFYKDI